jgi:hypothetical protein
MRRSIMQPLLLLGVFVLGGCNPGSASSPSLATRTSPTAQPFAMATPAPGALAVSDSILAGHLTFAFIQANDVWISLHGTPPQQVTHLGLGTQQLGWFLLWSPDQTKLFVDPTTLATDGAVSHAWIISVPGNTVQSLPSSSPVIASCANHNCAWLEDRYLVHQDISRSPAHSSYFRVYDTQAQRELSTRLDDQRATRMQVRGASVYFTPYELAPTSVPGSINRFDFNSNQITTQFSVPGPLIEGGLASGSWNLSADAREAVEHFSVGVAAQCPLATCSTFYQDTRGAIAVIFPSYQSQTGTGPALFDELSIAPDGKDAASLTNSNQVVQQALPSGHELLTALPAARAGQAYQLVGWTAQPPGIFVQELPTGAGTPPVTTRIYFVPLGEPAAAQLVETIGAGLVICAAPTA